MIIIIITSRYLLDWQPQQPWGPMEFNVKMDPKDPTMEWLMRVREHYNLNQENAKAPVEAWALKIKKESRILWHKILARRSEIQIVN
jgi:hypothetical protein